MKNKQQKHQMSEQLNKHDATKIDQLALLIFRSFSLVSMRQTFSCSTPREHRTEPIQKLFSKIDRLHISPDRSDSFKVARKLSCV